MKFCSSTRICPHQGCNDGDGPRPCLLEGIGNDCRYVVPASASAALCGSRHQQSLQNDVDKAIRNFYEQTNLKADGVLHFVCTKWVSRADAAVYDGAWQVFDGDRDATMGELRAGVETEINGLVSCLRPLMCLKPPYISEHEFLETITGYLRECVRCSHFAWDIGVKDGKLYARALGMKRREQTP